jgi:hypothetical protein
MGNCIAQNVEGQIDINVVHGAGAPAGGLYGVV